MCQAFNSVIGIQPLHPEFLIHAVPGLLGSPVFGSLISSEQSLETKTLTATERSLGLPVSHPQRAIASYLVDCLTHLVIFFQTLHRLVG